MPFLDLGRHAILLFLSFFFFFFLFSGHLFHSLNFFVNYVLEAQLGFEKDI